MEIYTVENQNLKIFYKKSFIPRSLKEVIIKEYGKFSMANPNKNYTKTDVIRNPFLPMSQMVFLIRYEDYYALVFRQGGRARGGRFIFCRIIEEEVVIIKKYSIYERINTIEEFISRIQSQKFYPMEWVHYGR